MEAITMKLDRGQNVRLIVSLLRFVISARRYFYSSRRFLGSIRRNPSSFRRFAKLTRSLLSSTRRFWQAIIRYKIHEVFSVFPRFGSLSAKNHIKMDEVKDTLKDCLEKIDRISSNSTTEQSSSTELTFTFQSVILWNVY